MPFAAEIDQHCASIFENERQYCQKRVQREVVNTERVTQMGAAHVVKARTEAERAVNRVASDGDDLVALVAARLRKDEELFAAELAKAEARLESARAHCRDRVQKAQDASNTAKLETAARVAQAEQANRATIDQVEQAAAAAEALAAKRRAELDASVAAAEAVATRVRSDAESRTAQQVAEHAQRAARIREEAQSRYERLLQDTAEAVELCVKRLSAKHKRAAAEIESREHRVKKEIGRAEFYIHHNERALASEITHRGTKCEQQANDAKMEALQRVRDAQQRHQDWCANEVLLTADELQAIDGLEDIAMQLRCSTLSKGLGAVPEDGQL